MDIGSDDRDADYTTMSVLPRLALLAPKSKADFEFGNYLRFLTIFLPKVVLRLYASRGQLFTVVGARKQKIRHYMVGP